MKVITNKKIVQKIVIAIVIVILTTFCIPIQSHADAGGKIMNPLIQLVAALFDGAQHLLEMTMLGRTESFMKELAKDDKYKADSAPSGDNVKEVDEFIDATFFGINAINIPTITYTPEEIFSNKVPALDINFINPSITKSADGKHDDEVQERNVAVKLRGTIAGWYNALTIIAMVGLLSVLVYLGIRMLLSSIAADRAKYKQMLMDWVVAMCLLFTLHFIMSFALTMVETVTAMLASDEDNTSITVYATNMDGLFSTYKVKFDTNLMNYVRFMVQAGDLSVKLGFLGLYIMLVIYSIRFTWVYLKRVINMAFLTLIAPMVALTYPIDKVSDGKAQAFNMWLKEFTYNALIQPIHLLLYKILLGSAIMIAADNPLYAIAALGFIIAAEKMVKQMFGFGKASGGTVASMAGAAGVTAFAAKMLNNAGKKVAGGASGNGKVRTKDIPERQGKDNGANKPFQAFSGRNTNQLIGAGSTRPTPGPTPDPGTGPNQDPGTGPVQAPGTGSTPGQQQDGVPLPQEDPNNEERLRMEEQLAQYDETDPYFMDPAHQQLQRQYQDLRDAENVAPEGTSENTGVDVPSPEEYNNPFAYNGPLEPDNFFDVVGRDVGNFGNRQLGRLGRLRDGIHSVRHTVEGRRNLKNKITSGLNNAAIGAWKALPSVGYKAARGTARLAAGAAMAGAGLAIGATTGSGEQALSMAAAAGTVGFTTGDNIFDATVGKVVRNPGNISDAFSDAYGASKYGNAVDARNAKADKEYVRSTKFDDFYEKEIKNKYRYSKDEFKKIATSYRQSGITAESDIKKAMKLEAYYQKNNANHLNEEDIRSQVQNIVAGYKELDSSQMKAFSGDKKAEEALRNELLVMLGGDKEANRAYVDTIYQGYKDYRTQT